MHVILNTECYKKLYMEVFHSVTHFLSLNVLEISCIYKHTYLKGDFILFCFLKKFYMCLRTSCMGEIEEMGEKWWRKFISPMCLTHLTCSASLESWTLGTNMQMKMLERGSGRETLCKVEEFWNKQFGKCKECYLGE